MKFGSSQLAFVKRPLVKARIAVSILVLLLAGAGYELFVTIAHSKNLSAELAAANSKIGTLNQDIQGLNDKIAKFDTLRAQWTQSANASNEKIGAFAKQAAICNTLREKLHIPQ